MSFYDTKQNILFIEQTNAHTLKTLLKTTNLLQKMKQICYLMAECSYRMACYQRNVRNC